MGGRVALEAVLRAPEAFRPAVTIAPYLPWRRFRGALRMGRCLSPRAAEKLPLETIWPLLKWLASTVERTPYLQDDHVAQAGVRMVYYAACPATRGSIISAAREMALDPAYGEPGLWTRLPELRVPCAFMWGERDRLVPASFARHVREALPEAGQILVPCLGHAINGPHGRCLARAVASALDALHSGSEARSADRAASAEPDEVDFVIASCSVESQEAPAPIPRAAS
jgi:pimeloyl-ACP methyl ester carboxylesterase